MYRLFIAIDFPSEILEMLSGLCHGVRGAKWVPPGQFHLTLQFIGDSDEGLYHDIVEALEGVRFGSFSLALSGSGVFPPRKPPRVLWVGVEKKPELFELVPAIEAELRSVGVEPEKRNFSPHVTIARFRDRVSPGDITPFLSATGLFRAGPFEVREFRLYSSVLRPDGAVHRVEATYPLF